MRKSFTGVKPCTGIAIVCFWHYKGRQFATHGNGPTLARGKNYHAYVFCRLAPREGRRVVSSRFYSSKVANGPAWLAHCQIPIVAKWRFFINKNNSGKLTEGWTDFVLKGGNVHWRMELDARIPGKTASHLVWLRLKMVHNRFGPKNCLDFFGHHSYNQEHGEKNRKRSITTKPGAWTL